MTLDSVLDLVDYEKRTCRIRTDDGRRVFETEADVPVFWSQTAGDIAVSKYLRRAGVPSLPGGRETSVRQLIWRVVRKISLHGQENGVLDHSSVDIFEAELAHMLVHQMAAFNSPVWFNVGIDLYGGRGHGGNHRYTPETGPYEVKDSCVHPQASACFIMKPGDSLDDIYRQLTEEMKVFRNGSGAGYNLSVIRECGAPLGKGGTSSGVMSFAKVLDSSAGAIKSGGSTRRSARMIILDMDHPDIETFIDWKVVEEKKAQALIAAGYPADFNGEVYQTVSGQNANNSVSITDEFMHAVASDAPWPLRSRTSGEVVREVKARDLWRKVAEAAWFCADPGIQFRTTINTWNCVPAMGEIEATNPCCFTAEMLVDTSEGLLSFAELEGMSRRGEELPLAYAFDKESRQPVLRPIKRAWVAGRAKNLVTVTTERGLVLRCTPEHRFLLRSGEYVEAQHLSAGTSLRSIQHLVTADESVVSVVHQSADENVYDIEVEGVHNFGVTMPNAESPHTIVVSNSEYVFPSNSACNLASINLGAFYTAAFNQHGFDCAVRVLITAMEILVGLASYPTWPIAENSYKYRPLGLGFANLGALLMRLGVPYDSVDGRLIAAALSSRLTAVAYHQSAVLAAQLGAFEGFQANRAAMISVLDRHRIASAGIPDNRWVGRTSGLWDATLEHALEHGLRNAQVSLMAPTGCLVGGSLVTTDQGLVRLRGLGDPDGEKWQDLDLKVATDAGPQRATKFFVNGVENVVNVRTSRGYRIDGTPTHRIKVVDSGGAWVWRRFSDLENGDVVPLALGQMIGQPRSVKLPPLPTAYRTTSTVCVPEAMTPDLAEFVGYFMGDGSLHTRTLRFCVTDGDVDVVDRLSALGSSLFGVRAAVRPTKNGYVEVCFHSSQLVAWWVASGFSKMPPSTEHRGKGYHPTIPDAVLDTNSPAVYSAFLRGLFEADGTVDQFGRPSLASACFQFSSEVQQLLLTLGVVTSLKTDTSGISGKPLAVLGTLNRTYARAFSDKIGFISDRKTGRLTQDQSGSGRNDTIPVTDEMYHRLRVGKSDSLKQVLSTQYSKSGGTALSRDAVRLCVEQDYDEEASRLLGFFFDRVESADLGDEQLTYDLSVPENVTYVANGFISHNTISFMMDCDTTGIEPGFSLVAYKKLSGGGNLTIVNQAVPAGLKELGYEDAHIARVVDRIKGARKVAATPVLAALMNESERQALDDLLPLASSLNSVLNEKNFPEFFSRVGGVDGLAIELLSAGQLTLTPCRSFNDLEDVLIGVGGIPTGELPEEHLGVFDCAVPCGKYGSRSLSPRSHVLMMAAIQPHISGAISKCVSADTVVPTAKGLRRVGSLYDGPAVPDTFSPLGLNVATRVGVEEAGKAYFNGVQPLLKATLADGRTLRATPPHRLLVVGRDSTGEEALVWKSMADLEPGDFVATRSGDELWGVDQPINFQDLPLHGSQHRTFKAPSNMSPDLGLFLGMLTADGHVTQSNYAVGFTKNNAEVRKEFIRLLHDLFGLVGHEIEDARNGVGGVTVGSKSLVTFLSYLGFSKENVPDAVLSSSKATVVAYLSGLYLDGWISQSVSLSQKHRGLLADVQLLWANMGVRSYFTNNPVNGVNYPVLHVSAECRKLAASTLRWLEPHKADRAATMTDGEDRRVFPFPVFRDFLGLLIRARGLIADFRSCLDHRTANPRVTSVVAAAEACGVQIHDEWLRYTYVPVVSVEDAGMEPVYDLEVIGSHSYVAGGILSHNTVNLPNSATVEDIEDVHMLAWRSGLKSIAIYRDGCKQSQPLNTSKKEEKKEQKVSDTIPAPSLHPARVRLPARVGGYRQKVEIGGMDVYLHIGLFDDGQPAELFVTVGKEGGTLRGLLDSLSTMVSIMLQHGVPLETIVDKLLHTNFEPAGPVQGDPRIKLSSSVLDYIARHLGVNYLHREDLAHVEGTKPDSWPEEAATNPSPIRASKKPGGSHTGQMCSACGGLTVQSGTCRVCTVCGVTTGCG